MLVDNVLIWWRNKAKEKKVRAGEQVDFNDPDVMLICDKQRETGVERSFKLWFHYPTATFFEIPEMYKKDNSDTAEENKDVSPWEHFD